MNYFNYEPEVVAKVLHMYAEGMPIQDIQHFFEVDVEKLLDKILPYV